MAQQFFTVLTSPNLYISCTVNNIDLIITLNNKKKRLDEKVPQNHQKIGNDG